tara:strand:- start:305 stop:589 length:285 start_codon:yes stop_codon:yes gene_type:complete
MESDLFGLLGLGLIVIAWIPGLLETIKSGKSGMRRRFMLLYFLGSMSLGIYAWQLNAIPFVILNIMAAIVPLVHLYFFIKKYGIKRILTPSSDL